MTAMPKKVVRGDEYLHCLELQDKTLRWKCVEHSFVRPARCIAADGEEFLVCPYCFYSSPNIPCTVYDGAEPAVGRTSVLEMEGSE